MEVYPLRENAQISIPNQCLLINSQPLTHHHHNTHQRIATNEGNVKA